MLLFLPMNKIKNFVKTHKKTSIALSLVILVVLFLTFTHKAKVIESYEVALGSIEQSVALSGTVETSSKADLGFAASGRIGKIYVKNNQKVSTGQILAQLEIGELVADLRIKEANARTSDVDLKQAKDRLEKVTKQENAKVDNAYRTLLSGDLEMVADSNSYVVDAPTISGSYLGTEGTYKIRFTKESPNSDDITVRTFDLEKTDKILNDQGKTALGTRGLYVDFSSDHGGYDDTTWYLEIPNKGGASYVKNFNAYMDAENDRDIAIKDAQAEYDKLLTKDNSGASVAQAEIQKIQAEIRKNTIYAPFTGIVTNIEKEVGENAGVGETVVSVLGEERLEVVLEVSELDVSKLVVGSSVNLSFDAFPGETFVGTLSTINSRETTVDGVPVYKAFVELAGDSRIKTGMSADATIVLVHKDDVLSVPAYSILKEEGKNFVKILGVDGKTEKREVTLGIVGSDSQIEILSGVSVGDKIVKNLE